MPTALTPRAHMNAVAKSGTKETAGNANVSNSEGQTHLQSKTAVENSQRSLKVTIVLLYSCTKQNNQIMDNDKQITMYSIHTLSRNITILNTKPLTQEFIYARTLESFVIV